jgi:hypothetical protein
VRAELGAGGIRVIDPDGQLELRARLAVRDHGGLDQLARGWALEQVDDCVPEVDCCRDLVLVDDLHVEDLVVEPLRLLRILDEEGDGTDVL